MLAGGLWLWQFNSATLPNIADAAQATKSHPLQKHPVELFTILHCGACEIMKERLSAAGIHFVVYNVETTRAHMDELNKRLKAHGVPTDEIPMPVIFAGDIYYIGPASVEELSKHIY